jgi:two-component sensor histidine kinase
MASRIRQQQIGIYRELEETQRRYSEQLEKLVEERTSELIRINANLQQEITVRKHTVEQLQALLREKEVLLREVHHRVDNNLQIISSLLDMSSMRTPHPQALEYLTSARARIHTMALIHSQLYRSQYVDQIPMGDYVRELVSYLSQVYASEVRRITLVVAPSDVVLSVTQAIPCALVLNELISNALRHAFGEGQPGTIMISLRKGDEDRVVVRVEDNGKGLPENMDLHRTGSLGFKLVTHLIEEQLQGSLHVERRRGAAFAIEFKIQKGKL